MATPTYQKFVLPLEVVETTKSDNTGLNKLFAAAIVNNQFCQMLLNQPELALQQGYFGDTFDLSLEEQALIVSIRAKSLPELAQQVTKALNC
jgi:hypothetical protein